MAYEKDKPIVNFMTSVLKITLYPIVFIYVIVNETLTWLYQKLKSLLYIFIEWFETFLEILKIVFKPLYNAVKWLFKKIKAFFNAIYHFFISVLDNLYNILQRLFRWLYHKFEFIFSPIVKGLNLLKRFAWFLIMKIRSFYVYVLIHLKNSSYDS